MILCTDKHSQKDTGKSSPAPIRALILFLLSIVFNSFAYGSTDNNEILSADERDWLTKNQPRLVLAVETGYAPFVFIDSNGQPSGLANDYMILLESKIGVYFQQRRFSTLADIFDKVHSGDVQIVNAVTNTPERSKFLSMTAPFVSVPNVIVVKKDRPGQMTNHALQDLNVSLVKSYAVTEYITNHDLHLIPDLVPNALTALLNVSFGRSDAAVIDLVTASYLITEKGITNLRVAGEAEYDIQLSIATPLNEPELHGILQKGLNAITDAERQEIKNRWINATKDQVIFNDRLFWVILASVLAIALVILTLVMIWNHTLRRQVVLRKQAESNLAESEARLQAIINNEPECIKIVDAQGRLIQMNPCWVGDDRGRVTGAGGRKACT